MITSHIVAFYVRNLNIQTQSLDKNYDFCMHRIMYQLWLIHSTISVADVVTGVLGHAMTLSCPGISNGFETIGAILSFKEWYHGLISSTESMVARMMTKRGQVKENSTVVERMGISSTDGDLMIHNLRMEDSGFYICSFTGSDAQTIQLKVIIGRFNLHVNSYKISINETMK